MSKVPLVVRLPLATFAILFAILLLTGPPDGILSDNEENYFGLAAQSLAPLTGSPHSALFDSSRHRFLNEFLLGHLIAGVGFEPAQRIARTLAAALGAWALSLLIRGLKVHAIDGAVAVMSFVVIGQSLFGGEWLFGGYESKVAAYVLVILGLHAVITHATLWWGVAAFIAASYFHFQIGGFWFLAAMLYLLIAGEFLRQTLAGLAVYGVGILPLLYIIISDRLRDVPVVDAHLPSPATIYSLFRAPHHVAPFSSWPQFIAAWLPGLVATALMLVGATTIAVRTRPLALRRLATWLTLLVGYLLIAVAVSFLDRRTGMLGKLYLFRPASLLLLLWLLLVAAAAHELQWGSARVLRPVFAAAILATFLIVSIGDIQTRIAWRNETERERAPLFGAVARLVGPREVVLIDPELEHDFDDFERRTQRATLVNWKFENTADRDITEWYKRVLFRAALFDRGCQTPPRWPVNVLLVASGRAQALSQSCGPLLYSDSKVALLRVRDMR